MAGVTALLAWFCGEKVNSVAFAASALVAVLLACVLYLPFRKSSRKELGILFCSAALAWLLFALIGGLPLAFSAIFGAAPDEFGDWTNCLFEGFSATTSCGLTIVADTAALPASLQFWRSFCQWTGGLGVLAAAITILDFGETKTGLYRAEARQRTIGDHDERRTGFLIWKTHTILSIVVILALGITGMPWWEALNHGMTAVSTGGFTMNGGGIGAYNRKIQAVMMVAMVLGAISFVHLSQVLFKGKPQLVWRDRNVRFFLLTVVVGAPVCYFLNPGTDPIDTVFLWISAITTSGFSTVSPMTATAPVATLLVLAMFVGGMAGSTAGGLKITRFLNIGSLLHRLSSQLLGKADYKDPEKWRESAVREEESLEHLGKPLVILLLWTVASLAGGVTLSYFTVGFEQGALAGIFEAVSALGCVGLSSGLTSADLQTAPKLLLCFLMWAGRIEILPILMLLRALRPKC